MYGASQICILESLTILSKVILNFILPSATKLVKPVNFAKITLIKKCFHHKIASVNSSVNVQLNELSKYKKLARLIIEIFYYFHR